MTYLHFINTWAYVFVISLLLVLFIKIKQYDNGKSHNNELLAWQGIAWLINLLIAVVVLHAIYQIL